MHGQSGQESGAMKYHKPVVYIATQLNNSTLTYSTAQCIYPQYNKRPFNKKPLTCSATYILYILDLDDYIVV